MNCRKKKLKSVTNKLASERERKKIIIKLALSGKGVILFEVPKAKNGRNVLRYIYCNPY